MHSFLALFSRFAAFLVTMLMLAPAALAQDGWFPEPYGSEGWKEIGRAEGDLNKDGRADIVLAIEAPEDITEPGNHCAEENAFSQAPARRLVVGFANGEGGHDIVLDDPKVMLRSDEGGVFGDPFDDLNIDRGSIVIDYFAGSRWRWGIGERFRYQDGGFKLIGLTEFSIDSISNRVITYDYNPLSSKLLIEVEESPDPEMRESEPACIFCRIGEECPEANGCYAGLKRAEQGKFWQDVERKPLIAIEDYRCWQESTGLLTHTGFNNGR